MSWIARTLARVFLFIGGICALALLAAGVSYVFGEREFPAYSSPDASFGTYLLEIGGTLLVAFILWRVCFQALLIRGSDRHVFGAMGREDEYDDQVTREEHLAHAQPIMSRCQLCPETGFRSWDEALDHAEDVHGHDRTLEEARALLERF